MVDARAGEQEREGERAERKTERERERADRAAKNNCVDEREEMPMGQRETDGNFAL